MFRRSRRPSGLQIPSYRLCPVVQGGTPQASLLQALTRTDRLGDLLPLLHQQAIEAVGGRSSIVFQFDPSGAWLQATSAHSVDRLPTEPWLATSGLVPQALYRGDGPVYVADVARSIQGVAEYLGTPAALLVPLSILDDRLGVLAVGCSAPPPEEQLPKVSDAGHALALALDRNRATRDADLQRELRALLDDFSRAVSSSFNLTAGLEVFGTGANRLFGADRSLVWLHDRRAKMMNLAAASDPVYVAGPRQVAAADAQAPAAVALRRDRAEIMPDKGSAPNKAMITIPLKGRRRALGTFVMEDVRLDPGSEFGLLERADEMGRQLSAALENVLLLDDVLRSRRELDNTFNSLADLVVVCSRDGRVVHVNQAFRTRAGKPKTELVDRPIDEVVAHGTRQLLARALDHSRESPAGVLRAEIEDPFLHGTFLMTVTPLIDEVEQPAGAVLVARDVTPHAQLEAERAELRNKLIQSEKLAALGQFVAGIAHELNNPLQGVLGHLELMRASGTFPKELRRDVQRIYREADRAAKIVRNLLVFAGSRRLVRKRVSVNAVLTRVFGLRAPSLRATGIEVVRDRNDALPRVKADPLLLQQAFLNIVLNAEQAIGMDGRIEARKMLLEDPPRIVVEIRDTGPGLSPEVLPRVFEPFYTTKEVGKGTGLGLAIAYGIIQEHGGQISASNHADGGAVFTVQLPVEPG
jgi:PAS domain S-box-containing protein